MKIEDLTKEVSKKLLTLKDIINKESPGTSEKPLIINQLILIKKINSIDECVPFH